MYQIDKTINFCYGHRVWTQELNEDYCAKGDNQTKCKHLHGHEGSVRVFLEAEELNNGFVTDFKHLGWLKDFIDAYIDHKFIVDFNDPGINQIVGGYINEHVFVEEDELCLRHSVEKSCIEIDDHIIPLEPLEGGLTETTWGLYVPDASPLEGYQKELIEGFLFVDFVPTSENLSKWLYEIVDKNMKRIDVVTSHIEWWETPKSRSVYFGNK
jgi:6-pyruvoyltetrahydropterin/6-carboxytetrahydropterin synthase